MNIYPTATTVPRLQREWLLQQHSRVLWLTGLSGSGKTTIAQQVELLLHERGYSTVLLDGDNLRMGLNQSLGFSSEDRQENIRRAAEVAKLFVDAGVIALCSFVSPTAAMRSMVATIIGKEDFIEIFVNTPIAECERRDTKGLYARARQGEIQDMTGINAPYEPPLNPALLIDTVGKTPAHSADELLQFILPIITYQVGIR